MMKTDWLYVMFLFDDVNLLFCIMFWYIGSMPPTSQYLWQEGMCVKSFKLVREGNFQEEGWYMCVCALCVRVCVCVCVCETDRQKEILITIHCVNICCGLLIYDLKHYHVLLSQKC